MEARIQEDSQSYVVVEERKFSFTVAGRQRDRRECKVILDGEAPIGTCSVVLTINKLNLCLA